MIKIFVRRGADITYLTTDRALELDGLRRGPALWAPLGAERSASAEDVLGDRKNGRVLGYDLVFAAPRPASCLLATGALDEQRAVIDAHRAAVGAALSYLDDRAVVIRRSVVGEIDEISTRWSAVASFTHGVNRAGEPHLHDHVLVSARTEHASRVLDGRALYAHADAADALYRAALRHEITERTGRESWLSARGIEYVRGVDEGVRALWPGRASDRGDKQNWTRRDIAERWRHDLAQYEQGPEIAIPARSRDHVNEHAFAAAFEGRYYIGRAEVVAAWANASTFGARATSVLANVDHWYPELIRERGRGAVLLSRERARMTDDVRVRGERRLENSDRDHLVSRDRERERTDISRFRSR